MTDMKRSPVTHSRYTDDELHRMRLLTESTRSLTYLEWVHEKQIRRMHTRSEWFLTPSPLMANR